MVEEWKIGDEFEVISDSPGEHLKKGDRGKIIGYTHTSSDYVYFKTSYSIRKDRIRKILKKPTYELW